MSLHTRNTSVIAVNKQELHVTGNVVSVQERFQVLESDSEVVGTVQTHAVHLVVLGVGRRLVDALKVVHRYQELGLSGVSRVRTVS